MPAGFAGTCVDCGRSMYKQNSKPDERLDSWVEKTTSTSCRSCHQRSRRKFGAPSRRASHSAACLDCGRTLRYKGEPVTAGERRRHARDRCSTCYRKSMAADVASRGVHVNCSVCLRVFGSRGVYGGTVSLGTKSTGVCTTCRDRNVQRRKRGEPEDGAG